MFENLCAKIREYAQQRKLEESIRKSKGDPMNIGELNKEGGEVPANGTGQRGEEYSDEEWNE